MDDFLAHILVVDDDEGIRSLVKRYLNENKPGKILDVGCGHGWLLSSLNYKWNKFGLDVSSFALKSASKYSKTFLGDINDIKEKDFEGIEVISNLGSFAERSDLIIANRLSDDLNPFKNKVYSRDIYKEN